MRQTSTSKPSLFGGAPDFADPCKTLIAHQIFAIVQVFLLSLSVLQVVQIVLTPKATGRLLVLWLASVLVGIFLLELVRRGHVRSAAFQLVLSLWLLISLLSWIPGGLGPRAAWGYFIVVFIAGMLLGRWIGILTAAVCSVSTLAIALGAPFVSPDPIRFWLINTLYLLIVYLLQNLAGFSTREALAKTGSELRERLLAQAALFESEKKHRELVNSLPFCVFEADLNGRLTFTNQTALDWFGYTEADFLAGRNVLDIVDDVDKPRVRDAMRRIASGEQVPFHEYLVRRKDGSRFTSLIRTRPIFEKGLSIGLQGSLIDISDRKQAEKDRELVISLLKATLESTTDGILVIDLAGKIAHYNQRFVDMWRIPEEILASGEDMQALAFVCNLLLDPQGFIDKVQRLYTDPLMESFDLLEFKDGRYFERYSRPQLLGGRPVGRVWSFRDITERKRAEKDLFLNSRRTHVLLQFGQMTEAPLQQITDFALEKAVELTQSKIGYVAILNEDESILTMHSWSKSAMAECNIADKPIVYPVKTTGLWGEAVRQRRPVISNDYFASPWKRGFPEGHVALNRHMNVPVFQGSRIVLVAGVGNKTEEYNLEDAQQLTLIMEGMWRLIEHKREEEKTLESERRYRTLFEAASDAIFVMKDSLFYDCNSRTLEMFGCTREQILGKTPDLFSPPLQPDGSDSWDKAREKILAAYAGNPQFFEWVHCRADGTPFDAEVSLARIDLAADVFLLAMVRDISVRKRLEEQLRQAQKMEAIGILAGGVAHDFNNILSTIVGYSSLLQMKMQADNPFKNYIERILTATERAANLTNSLLAFSRKQEIELLPLDINDAIYGFHKILARLIGEDIDFSLNLASQSLVVDADVRQIEQVLMNLANNSRDAMPRGGKLTIRTAAVVLDEALGEIPAGSYAALTVADSGTGMGQDIQAHVFEPFFTTKEVGKGTGLGLAIVYGIIRKHRGFIHMDSVPGQGTTFSIYLPLNTQMVKKTTRRKRDRIPTGSETILLIEDDPAVRQVTRSMLEEFGYKVLEAADGIEGQSLFQRHREKVQLILCDLIMPKMNGRETLAEIKKLRSDVKAIFMSGYTADIIAGKGISDPGLPLLLKPLNPSSLLKKIRSVLDS